MFVLLLLQAATDLEGVTDETSVRSFADKYVKAGTLTLCMDEELVLALGGGGRPDGVSVVLIRPPEGRSFALGGDGASDGRAGIACVYYGGSSVTSGSPGAWPRGGGRPGKGGTGSAHAGGREMKALSGMTGEGGASTDASLLLPREAGDKLSNAFEDLVRALDKEADEKKRRKLIEEFLGAQEAPTCSAVVFSSSGGWVLAMGSEGVDVSVPVCPLNVIAAAGAGAKATSKAKTKYLFDGKKK